MLYSEFVENTGCRDNAHNYRVYKNLEIAYTNSDMTKAEIYAAAMPLLDNGPSESEKRTAAEIRAEIETIRAGIELNKSWIESTTRTRDLYSDDKSAVKWYNSCIRGYKQAIREKKTRIKTLEYVFADLLRRCPA